MDITITALIEHRDRAQQALPLSGVSDRLMPLPGASSCCGSGCSSSSCCSCSW
jgi:hypothetical protein